MSLTSKISMLALAAVIFSSCTKDPTEKLVPETADQDPSIPSIKVNGALLHSEAFGHPDSAMIICLHGGPGSDYRYMLNCRELAGQGYRVVFYDQRGSGLSQRFSKDSYTSMGAGAFDLMFDELTGVIAHYRTSPSQKVYLLGHSWGGILAAGYAGRYPQSIQGIMVCEPGGFKWDDIVHYVKESRSFNLWGENMNDASYIDQFLSGKENDHSMLDYKLAMLAGKNEVTQEDNTEAGSFWRKGAVINGAMFELADRLKPDFSAGLQDLQPKALLLYSEKNGAYSDSWAKKIGSAFPAVTIVKIPGVGHDGIIKDHNAWNSHTMPAVLQYLNSL